MEWGSKRKVASDGCVSQPATSGGNQNGIPPGSPLGCCGGGGGVTWEEPREHVHQLPSVWSLGVLSTQNFLRVPPASEQSSRTERQVFAVLPSEKHGGVRGDQRESWGQAHQGPVAWVPLAGSSAGKVPKSFGSMCFSSRVCSAPSSVASLLGR